MLPIQILTLQLHQPKAQPQAQAKLLRVEKKEVKYKDKGREGEAENYRLILI